MDNNIQTAFKTKERDKSAPNILAGMIPIAFILLTSFLSLSWYIIDYQVENLVAKRTSEYAHSIVKIAADSSAEALLSEDNLQLELLAQNIAKDRYIHTATIYSADGIIVTKYPQKNITEQSTAEQSNSLTFREINNSKEMANKSSSIVKSSLENEKKSNKDSVKKLEFDYLSAKKNIPFIEKIAFNGVTAGWFKIEIDGFELESDFRASFHRIRLRIFVLASFLVLSLIYCLFRYKRKVNRVVTAIHLLVNRKAVESEIEVGDSQELWFEQVENLADASFSKPIRLRELRQHVRWQDEEAIESVPLVWFAIDLPKPDNHDLAQQVVKIEKYLKSATNAYSTFFQGEIFAGGLVPFLQHSASEEGTLQSSLIELVSFTFLLKELMASMDANIKFKAILFNSRVSRLYSDDSAQNRVILPQRKQLQISKLANILNESCISCLTAEPRIYDELAEYETYIHKQKKITNTYLIKEPNHDIVNHVARITKTIIDSDIRS
ncbi:MAG: hypothetical protein COB38_00070 [Gammaproteobacteria bacterium]|nr:MAG: hypothetical protein COB38_00070 [Gammaproteobacteria bacterium]